MIAKFNPASHTFSRIWPALVAGVALLCVGVLLADAAEPVASKPPVKPPSTVPLKSEAKAATLPSASGNSIPVDADLRAKTELRTLELDITAAKLRLKSAEVIRRSKERSLDHQKAAHANGAGSDGEVENAQMEFDLAEISAGLAEVEVHRAELKYEVALAASKEAASGVDPVIRPNDWLHISLSDVNPGMMEERNKFHVNRAGNIRLPLLGKVKAAGFTEAELEKSIDDQYNHGISKEARV